MFNAIGRGEEIEAEAIQLFASSNRMWRKTKHTPEALQQFRELREASAIGDVWFHNIYLSNLAAGLTHYGTTPAPMYFSQNYASFNQWWRVGFLVSLWNLAVWDVVGSAWWKLIGLW